MLRSMLSGLMALVLFFAVSASAVEEIRVGFGCNDWKDLTWVRSYKQAQDDQSRATEIARLALQGKCTLAVAFKVEIDATPIEGGVRAVRAYPYYMPDMLEPEKAFRRWRPPPRIMFFLPDAFDKKE